MFLRYTTIDGEDVTYNLNRCYKIEPYENEIRLFESCREYCSMEFPSEEVTKTMYKDILTNIQKGITYMCI